MTVEEEFVIRIITGISDSEVHRKLMAERNLTLQHILNICHSEETSRKVDDMIPGLQSRAVITKNPCQIFCYHSQSHSETTKCGNCGGDAHSNLELPGS